MEFLQQYLDILACFLRGYGNQIIWSITNNTASVGTAQNDTVIGHTHSGQSGQFLSTSTSTSTTTINGYASIAVQKPSASNFGTTGGVDSGGSGSETAPLIILLLLFYFSPIINI